MFGCIITVKTLTHALRGEAFLKNRGIVCRVVKPDGENVGCRYGIALNCNYAKSAFDMLKKAGFEVVKILA